MFTRLFQLLAVAVMARVTDSIVAMAMVPIAKSLYTRLYIYAKTLLVLHKYTVVTAVFRDALSRFFYQTRTLLGTVWAVSGHREDCKSNNILQNRGIFRLFRCYFRLF